MNITPELFLSVFLQKSIQHLLEKLNPLRNKVMVPDNWRSSSHPVTQSQHHKYRSNQYSGLESVRYHNGFDATLLTKLVNSKSKNFTKLIL